MALGAAINTYYEKLHDENHLIIMSFKNILAHFTAMNFVLNVVCSSVALVLTDCHE